ncbi:MAG: TraA family conjugative transfer protein [Succinivibrio sp.]
MNKMQLTQPGARARLAADMAVAALKLAIVMLALLAVASLLAGVADATTSSDQFGEIESKIAGYMKGTLGVIISLCVFLAGAVQTIRSGQIFFVMTGIALAIILYNAPKVIESMMDATALADAATAVPLDMDAVRAAIAR